MKKFVLTMLVALGAYTGFAQKYLTRTGKVSFFSSTPIENIEAFNNESSAIIDASAGDVVFIVPVKSFKFEKALMQEHFNENYMESDKYPKADFKGKISDLSEVAFQKDGIYKVQLQGTLTIHGVARQVTLPGTITVKGNTITATAKFMVKTADYEIKIPSMAASKIAKEIEVNVNTVLNRK